MRKIELSKEEIEMIKRYERDEYFHDTMTEEQREIFGCVIDKAEALEEELDAYEESRSDLIRWFYAKYKTQKI